MLTTLSPNSFNIFGVHWCLICLKQSIDNPRKCADKNGDTTKVFRISSEFICLLVHVLNLEAAIRLPVSSGEYAGEHVQIATPLVYE